MVWELESGVFWRRPKENVISNRLLGISGKVSSSPGPTIWSCDYGEPELGPNRQLEHSNCFRGVVYENFVGGGDFLPSSLSKAGCSSDRADLPRPEASTPNPVVIVLLSSP